MTWMTEVCFAISLFFQSVPMVPMEWNAGKPAIVPPAFVTE